MNHEKELAFPSGHPQTGGSADTGDHKPQSWWLMFEGEQLEEGLDV